MKTLVFSLAAMLMTSFAFGQGGKYGATDEDSVECITNLSLYAEFVKQKNYVDALPMWQKAVTGCPNSSKKLYINGVKMYRKFVSQEKGKEARAVLVDSLMWVYDARIQAFGQEGFVLGRKGGDLFRIYKNRAGEANAMLKKSMELTGDKCEATVLSNYYLSLFEMAKNGEADKAALLEAYIPVNEQMELCIAKAKTAKNADRLLPKYEAARKNIDEIFVKVGECTDIVPIFQAKYDATPEDLELQKKILKVLTKRGCTDNELFKACAVKVHEVEPSAESAFSIGKMKMSDKKYSEALKYFKQALEMCPDCVEKESYLLGAATASLKTGSYSSAYNYAGQVHSLNANSGEAYLIKAQAVANTKQGTNATELKYVYWLAYDLASKAKSVDSGVADKASRLMSSYKKAWPTKEDLFAIGVWGVKETVTVGGWINQPTKVRVAE